MSNSRNQFLSQQLQQLMGLDWEPIMVNLNTDPITVQFQRSKSTLQHQHWQQITRELQARTIAYGWEVAGWDSLGDHVRITFSHAKER